jgi:hypothetical protein
MHNLLAKMEAELNKLAQQKQEIYKQGGPTTAIELEAVAVIQKKQIQLRALITKYTAIQSEFLELTAALSVY